MMLASEHYRALLEDTDISSLTDVESIQTALRKIVSDAQQLTLSQISDSTTRQLGSILFSHEAGLISALSALRPPEVKWEKEKRITLNLLFFFISFIVSLACISLSWDAGKKLLAILIGGTEILSALAVFFPRYKPKATINQNVNAEALFSLMERRMEAIDRDLEAFLSLPGSESGEDESVLHLITKVVSMKREDPESIPDEIMTLITALSISRGYQFLDYTEENAPLFDVMPTIRNTRTIVPALLKNGKLLVRGMAIHHIDESSEDE